MAAKYGDAAPFDAQGVSGGGSEALGASTGTIEGVFFALRRGIWLNSVANWCTGRLRRYDFVRFSSDSQR